MVARQRTPCSGGSLVIPTANAPKRVNLTDEAIEFLKFAIPALMEYERRGEEAAIPKPPEKLAGPRSVGMLPERA